MTGSSRHPVFARVPADLAVMLDNEAESTDMKKQDVVTEALEFYFGVDPGDDPAALDRAISRLEDDIADINQQIDDLTESVQRKQNQIDIMISKRDDLVEDTVRYQDWMDDILADLDRRPVRITMFTPELKDAAAREKGRSTSANVEAVVQDLIDRAEDVGPDIPDDKWGDYVTQKNVTPAAATADGGDDGSIYSGGDA